MTTNADYTFTPHPSPEEIQDQWNVSLIGIKDEGENQALAAHLRSVWRENWWKYPDNIKRSFLSAARKTATTKTNIRSPTKHVLYRGPVHFHRHDFDWGVWLVLRGIYYDANKNVTNSRAQMVRSSFSRGLAKKMIMERYQGIDVLEANVPPTFPPRPLSWDKTSDGQDVSHTSPETKIRAAPASNQLSTGEGDGVQDSEAGYGAETADDESDSSPSPDDATSRVKEAAEKHISTAGQGGGLYPRANLDLALPSLGAAFSAVNNTLDCLIQSTNQAQASLNALLQGPANEGDHHSEKAADTSIDSNGHSDESIGVPKSLPKRSMSDDEEEDSPCGEHTQKRRCTSSDRSHSPEPEAMPNSDLQKAIFGEDLDRVHELWKKTFNEKVAEIVSQQVAQRTEGLQPRIKDEMTQFLSEEIFGSTENSGLSNIAQRVIDTLAEQMASKMAQQVIQQTTQQLTKELTSELQPEADQQLADFLTQMIMVKLFGSTGTPGL